MTHMGGLAQYIRRAIPLLGKRTAGENNTTCQEEAFILREVGLAEVGYPITVQVEEEYRQQPALRAATPELIDH